jgi:metal-responsive CopG/Arc/MetJ family transcriptional regulator
MPHVKTAITVPADVLADIDRAARARGESRSKFVTRVLCAAVRARRDADVTRRLNELFAQDEVTTAQRAETSFLDDIGTSWTDERW